MDPHDFQSLAARLVAGGTAAADCRTAVGRAYYSVFNVAADHFRAAFPHITANFASRRPYIKSAVWSGLL